MNDALGHWLVVRPAVEADLEAIERMIDRHVVGHPAQPHPRPRAALREAYFGPRSVAQLLVASRDGEVIGMVEWMRIYDMFWAKFGARVEWFYVERDRRGLGVGAALVAELCAQAKRAGCEFLNGSADSPENVKLYERVGIGSTSRSVHVSAAAFEAFAALAGLPPREIVRRLPDPGLNHVAPA